MPPTQKRRIVYLADEDWGTLQAHASIGDKSISQVVRDLVEWIRQGRPITEKAVETNATTFSQTTRFTPTAEERKVQDAPVPGERSFGKSRAAPKK
ncbi:MAG TPA: hypothetical protein VFH61_00710 [Thermoleophilia bacterium]|nr:hypothetical protein [Thermoleophilia bacterium]